MADLIFLAPYYPYRGGIALHTAYLANALHWMGVNLSIISYRQQYPNRLYPGGSQFEPSPLAVDLQPVNYIYDPLNPGTWKTVYKAVQQSGAGALVIPWWHTFLAPGYTWLMKRLVKAGLKVIYMVHNVLPHEHHTGERLLARMALQPASGYIVQAVSQKIAIERLLGSHCRIKLVSHPLYPPQAVLPGRNEARQTLGIPVDDRIFLSFGFQRAYKGVVDVLQAFEALRLNDHIRLAVIGEGWVKEASAAARIHRLESYLPSDELMRWIAASDWFLAANRQATQSGSLALAMGCGMPVIVSDVLAFQAVDNSNSRVEIFPAGDVNALTDVIKKVVAVPTPLRVLPDIRPGWQAMAQAAIRLSGL